MCLDESLDISLFNTNMASVIDSLRKQISTCEATLQDLRHQLAEAEHIHRQQAEVVPKKRPLVTDPTNPLDHDMNFGVPDDFRSEIFAVLEQEAKAPEKGVSQENLRWPLEKNEYKRYGRQLIMPEIGLQGQYFFSGHNPGGTLSLLMPRSTSPEKCPCTHCRSGRSWLSSRSIPRGRRCRYCRLSGWRRG
jgi:hypothetical protein